MVAKASLVTGSSIRFAIAGLALPLLAAPAVPAPATLTVYAAASLTAAFGQLGRMMEQSHPGLSMRFNFAGSQQLASQLEQGAPADVLASADQRWMDYAKDKGLISGEATVFARNRLVVIVPRTRSGGVERLEDLGRRGIKLVIAAEAVPAGRYSLEAIRKLAAAPGFPAEYESRVLGNVVSQEENVKSVVAKVQLNEADAGFVYRSDVTPPVSRAVRVLEIPDRFNVIASYPIAILKSAENRGAAHQFLDLLLSDQGQQVLLRQGFSRAQVGKPSATQP
jgi:molybdate transport system substrate-binding protein